PAGEAVATTAGRLSARRVIHTVGPVRSSQGDRSEVLRSCYRNSLRVADELGAESIAFPLSSSGVYRWPRDDAIRLAVDTLRETETAVSRARLVLFDEATYRRAADAYPRPNE